MLSTIINPKIPKGPHNRHKTGIMAISRFTSEVESTILKNTSFNIIIPSGKN
jgi:lysophospholipid acyltransferase (LPLAT)-like uncharacterized protein